MYNGTGEPGAQSHCLAGGPARRLAGAVPQAMVEGTGVQGEHCSLSVPGGWGEGWSLFPACRSAGVSGKQVSWAWTLAGARNPGRPRVVCRGSGVGDPAQAAYTIVLMPLGLALLLVGGGGAGGCPWWCAAWPPWLWLAWAAGNGGWPCV